MPEEPALEKLVVRDAEGLITEEAYMKDGVLEGETVLYARDRVAARILFHEGKQNGESIFYDEAGRMTTRAQYLDGQMHGDLLHYDQWGRVFRKSTYSEGQLNGRSIDYYPNGRAREVSTYKDNLLEGEMMRLDEEGKVLERRYYHLGRETKPPAGKRPAQGTTR